MATEEFIIGYIQNPEVTSEMSDAEVLRICHCSVRRRAVIRAEALRSDRHTYTEETGRYFHTQVSDHGYVARFSGSNWNTSIIILDIDGHITYGSS